MKATAGPDFFDPDYQKTEPSPSMLKLLRLLTHSFSTVISTCHSEEVAIGALLIAQGIELAPDPSPPPMVDGLSTKSTLIRLKLNGIRWKELLESGEKKDPCKARGLVLTFIWSSYQDHKPGTAPTSQSQSIAMASAEIGPISIHNHIPAPVVNISLPPATIAPAEAKSVERFDGLRRLKLPRDYRWADITFVIIDEETFKILAGATKIRLNIRDVGLVDRRRGNAGGKQSWVLLQELAAEPHVLPVRNRDGKIIRAISKKDISELRTWLREFTGLTEDPFMPFIQDLGWRPFFKIMESKYTGCDNSPDE